MVELVQALNRPHIRFKYHIQPDDITALINLIRLRGELVTPDQQVDACRDPKDNRFLEAAVEGDADVIVSGDADLVDMMKYEDILILSVAEFLAQF